MKYAIIILAIIIGAFGTYVFFFTGNETVEYETNATPMDDRTEQDVIEVDEATNHDSDVTETEEQNVEGTTVFGLSANGNDIVAHRFGTGDIHLMFIGGIHGGYSWNTILVARELIEYLEANPETVPENVRVTVIPLLNPDGLEKVAGTTGAFTTSDISTEEGATVVGRFNGNDVDLNRNFDCEWQSTGTWQDREVDGGSAPFSEPEAAAIRDYTAENAPDAVVVYYSAAGGVFASNCRNGVSNETRVLTNIYADAAGYQAFESYDFYEITGDMANWFAAEDIPAISVLLTSHEVVEWEKNRDGVMELFDWYSTRGE